MSERLLPLKLPPGLSKPGTIYQSRGRWYNAQLVRFFAGAVQPVGGWQVGVGDGTGNNPGVLIGIPRTMYAWRPDSSAVTDDGPPFIAIGTHLKLYVISGNTLYDETPTPFPPTWHPLFTGTLVTSGVTGAASATINITATTLTGSVQTGDKLMIAGTFYTVTAPVAAVANVIAVPVAPSTPASIPAGTAVIVGWPDSNDPGGSGTYGYSTYGQGVYGTGAIVAAFTNATTWQLDNFGQSLLALATADGHLYVWAAATGTAAARPAWSPTFTGSLVTSGSTSAGANQILLTATTLTGTILHGQTFTIAGTLYTCSGDATAVANVLTVPTTPPVPAIIGTGTSVTTWDQQAPDGRAVVATPEGYAMVLGAQGIARRAMWADRRSISQWGPLTINEAGSYDLPTTGRLLAGRRTRNQTLLWTDVDVWAASWVGLPAVYRFDQVGDRCGPISPNSMCTLGTEAIWMGANAFYAYDGYTRELHCEVADFVFNNINRKQQAKCWAMPIPQYGESWFFYPSALSNEVDSYVVFNAWENHWTIGTLARTAGFPNGSMQYPLMASAAGLMYEHEFGNLRTGEATAFVESGPIELGVGDQIMSITQILTDEKTLGDISLGLYYSMDPALPYSAVGTNPQLNELLKSIALFTRTPTNVRLTARQVRLRFTEARPTAWRVGDVRLGVVAGGRR